MTAAELAAIETDAERWRALMSSARLHFMGSAGFEMRQKDAAVSSRDKANLTAIPKPGEMLHFGMEFWSSHPAAGDPRYPDQFERDLMVAYVDALREKQGAAA